jgi:hypothetical protein
MKVMLFEFIIIRTAVILFMRASQVNLALMVVVGNNCMCQQDDVGKKD